MKFGLFVVVLLNCVLMCKVYGDESSVFCAIRLGVLLCVHLLELHWPLIDVAAKQTSDM